jgi:bifunctional N-acetylglucosamine-1-phosphate-uridyltransferase/glucosamine-1-phosphate-acetyltransferase GlmU-like protein
MPPLVLGSALNIDAPAEQLTLARAKQVSADNWQRPQKATNHTAEIDSLK